MTEQFGEFIAGEAEEMKASKPKQMRGECVVVVNNNETGFKFSHDLTINSYGEKRL